jgi:hypothetical protein
MRANERDPLTGMRHWVSNRAAGGQMYKIIITAISGGKPGLYRDQYGKVPSFKTYTEAQSFILDHDRELSQYVIDIQFRSQRSNSRRTR